MSGPSRPRNFLKFGPLLGLRTAFGAVVALGTALALTGAKAPAPPKDASSGKGALVAAGPDRDGPDPAGDLYKKAKQAYEKLDALPPEKKAKRHSWEDSINGFKAVAEKYPRSYVADDALYMLGELYVALHAVSGFPTDLDRAIDAYKKCAKEFPKSNYADDCLLNQAKALVRRNKRTQAIAVLKTIATDYRSGDMLREAEVMLAREGIKVEAPASTPAPAPTPAIAAIPEKMPRSGGTAGATSVPLQSVKWFSSEATTDVTIKVGAVAWDFKELPAIEGKDRRIYVDLKKAHVGPDIQKAAVAEGGGWTMTIDDGLLRQVRVAQFDPDTVRVVFDVLSIESWTVLPLGDEKIILKVFGKRVAPLAAAATPSETATPAAAPTPEMTAAPGITPGLVIALPTPSTTPNPVAVATSLKESAAKTGVPLFQELGLKVGKIYVDAGHGGHDPGAHGPSGLLEKDVTLALSKKLKKELEELGYEVVLTRSDDTFLELEERSGIANKGQGDLFVSIHCNSTAGNKSASGVETYFANNASDEAAARHAAQENRTTEKKMSELEQILGGLARSAYTELSGKLAGSVQKSLYAEVRKVNPDAKNYGVKSALFYVLFTANMPAVLVETSFISNKHDEKRLKDDKYLGKLAKAIAEGVDQYLQSLIPVPVVEPKKDPPKKAELAPKDKEAVAKQP